MYLKNLKLYCYFNKFQTCTIEIRNEIVPTSISLIVVWISSRIFFWSSTVTDMEPSLSHWTLCCNMLMCRLQRKHKNHQNDLRVRVLIIDANTYQTKHLNDRLDKQHMFINPLKIFWRSTMPHRCVKVKTFCRSIHKPLMFYGSILLWKIWQFLFVHSCFYL